MAKLSKYFTPALNQSDLGLIAKILGVTEVNIGWNEKISGKSVVQQIWRNGFPNTVFLQSSNLQSDLSFGNIVFEHNNRKLKDNRIDGPPSVFEKILPFPYSFLVSTRTSQDGFISYEPETFESSLKFFQSQTGQLENEISKFELTLLWIHDNNDSMPLLFHFVRKTLIRVGTVPALCELVQKYQQKQLGPSDLRQFFGTNAAFFELNTDKFNHLDNPLDKLGSIIQEMLRSSDSHVIGESLLTLESPPLMDFEL